MSFRFHHLTATAALFVSFSASAATYHCQGVQNARAHDYMITLNEITGLTPEPLWQMKIVNNSAVDGKVYSGIANFYFNNGQYTYDKVTRYYELNEEVLAVNSVTGKVTFKPNIRLTMPIACQEI
jgi:hypothetical protein